MSTLVVVGVTATIVGPPDAGTGAAPVLASIHNRYRPDGVFLSWDRAEPFDNSDTVHVGEDGVPSARYGSRWWHNPTTIAQYGLQQFSYLSAGLGDGSERAAAIRAADWLVDHQEPDGRWLYGFDYEFAPTDDGRAVTLRAPWSSALAQGNALSLLTRAYRLTDDDRYLTAAARAVRPLAVPVDGGGMLGDFDGQPVFEEYPVDPPSHVLNGFMFTLVGLHDAAELGVADAAQLFNDGMASLEAILPDYDLLGETPAYDLLHLTDAPREIRWNASYEWIHADLLVALRSITGSSTVARWLHAWYPEVYDDGADHAGRNDARIE